VTKFWKKITELKRLAACVNISFVCSVETASCISVMTNMPETNTEMHYT